MKRLTGHGFDITIEMLKVHAHLLENLKEKHTHPSIASACDLPYKSALRALERLYGQGFISKHRFKNNGRPYYLALIPQEITE